MSKNNKQKYIVQAYLLNVRTGPDITYMIIRKLKQGKIVKVKEYWNEWARIGLFQWVNSRYLKRIWDDG